MSWNNVAIPDHIITDVIASVLYDINASQEVFHLRKPRIPEAGKTEKDSEALYNKCTTVGGSLWLPSLPRSWHFSLNKVQLDEWTEPNS